MTSLTAMSFFVLNVRLELHRQEFLVEDSEIWTKLFLLLLFCVYSRSRWSDAQHGEKFVEDMDEGLVHTLKYQVGFTRQIKQMCLPLVAPCEEIATDNWDETWCKCRRELDIMTSRVLLRTVSMSPRLKQGAGCVRSVKSHSLKVTCLSYAMQQKGNCHSRTI